MPALQSKPPTKSDIHAWLVSAKNIHLITYC